MTRTARFIQAITTLLAQTIAAIAVLAMWFAPQPANAMLPLHSVASRAASSAASNTASGGAIRPAAYLPVLLTHSLPDVYEPDDTCATQGNIAPGDIQTHTFESLTGTVDIDLIQLKFVHAGRYDARAAAIGEAVSPRIEVAVVCGGSALDAFTPGGPIRLVVPSDNYTVYLTARDTGAANAQDTTYRISISTPVAAQAEAADADGLRVVLLPRSSNPPSTSQGSP